MKTSESIKSIIPALFEARKAITVVSKNAKNPFFESKYADLNSVLEAIEPALTAQGLMVLQPVRLAESGYVETIIFHVESQEWVSSETPIVCKTQDPQKQGSAITYARRYGLTSLVVLKAVDDDAENAMSREPDPRKVKRPGRGELAKIMAVTEKMSIEHRQAFWRFIKRKEWGDITVPDMVRVNKYVHEYKKKVLNGESHA